MNRFQAQICLLTASLLVASLSTFGGAGEKKKDGMDIPEVKRGPEHKVLESLVGVFDAKVKLSMDPTKPAAESNGVLTRKMILDGMFLQESFSGTFFNKPFKGLGVIGFDQAKKSYITTWFDNMSTSTMVMTGTYDAASKTLTAVGEDWDQGKKMKARDLLKIISDDEQSFEMFRQPESGAKEMKVMEISYKRRAEKSKLPPL